MNEILERLTHIQRSPVKDCTRFTISGEPNTELLQQRVLSISSLRNYAGGLYSS